MLTQQNKPCYYSISLTGGYKMTKKPIGAWTTFKWLDTQDIREDAYFSFGDGLEETLDEDTGDIVADHWGIPDEQIFYFVTGEEELKSFMTDGVEEFTVLEYRLIYEENT